jgi:siroheme synthase
MPGSNYIEISSGLRAAGFAQETPCAIISRATTPQQQIHHTTVSDLPQAPRLAPPTLLVVGEVVKFADPSLVEEGLVEEAASLPHPENALGAGFTRGAFLPAESLRTHEEPLA